MLIIQFQSLQFFNKVVCLINYELFFFFFFFQNINADTMNWFLNAQSEQELPVHLALSINSKKKS